MLCFCYVKKETGFPAFLDNNLRRRVSEEGRVHSSEGIETFLSMPCCPVWKHIFIFLLLLLPCGTELVIFCVSRELIFAISSCN